MNYAQRQTDGDYRPESSISDLDLLEELAHREARERFWAYRQYINPDMKIGWFQAYLAGALQEWFEDFKESLRPILILATPPQHGKSKTVADFESWVKGHNPDLATIFTSFSDRLGIRTNRDLQRIYDSYKYKACFPGTRINDETNTDRQNQALRNQKILEFVKRRGSFRNTTIEGSITGEGLDIGIIDDPLKGRKEAKSPTRRDAVWDWLVDDFMSRFADHAGLILIMTRWHLDDPAGRLMELFPEARLLRFPAIADPGTKLESFDPRKPGSGEPLFPEHKSETFLRNRQRSMTDSSWQAIYQQDPQKAGGTLFPIDRIHVMEHAPVREEIKRSVRYWDKAGTQDGGAYTAGVLMHELKDGRIVIEDVRRGQWEAVTREKNIKQTAEIDGKSVRIWVEQEGGSGGKESAEATIRMLKGWRAFADKATGDKEVRAEPFAAQVQGGNVWIVAGKWNQAYLDELEDAPNGTFKDQWDSSAGAFNKLVSKGGPVSEDDFGAYGQTTRPDF